MQSKIIIVTWVLIFITAVVFSKEVRIVSPEVLMNNGLIYNGLNYKHSIVKRAGDNLKRRSRGSMTYAESLKLEQGQHHDDGFYDEMIYSLMDTIPGRAGKDYPVNEKIPKTSFSCKGRKSVGYYADVETRCQVFHICMPGGHKMSFMCPKGSVFNQKVSVCDWWYDVDCQATSLGLFSNEIEGKESSNIVERDYAHVLAVNELENLNLVSPETDSDDFSKAVAGDSEANKTTRKA